MATAPLLSKFQNFFFARNDRNATPCVAEDMAAMSTGRLAVMGDGDDLDRHWGLIGD